MDAGKAERGDPSGKLLKRRHVTMISIGGIIGSGLFLGSSSAIASTGPAVIISYIAAGLLVLAVMTCLGELALAAPGASSFTEYIRFGLGDWAGFACGWLYWIFWVLAVAFEALAAASVLEYWVPVSAMMLGILLLAMMTGVNLLSARSYGESEFWLSSLKIAAVLIFIALGGWFIVRHLIANGATPISFAGHGGFMPFGLPSVLAGMVTVVFALVGAEIVTIAAAESDTPAQEISRLSTMLILRIMLFYVLSMLVIILIVPWDRIAPGSQPFAMALEAMNTPNTAVMMRLVILISALSCLNSGVYVCSRVLVGLAGKREAPKAMVVLSGRNVPVRAILTGSAIGMAVLLSSNWAGGRLLALLINATGSIMLIIYLLLAAAYIRSVRMGRVRKRSGLVPAAWTAAAAMIAILWAMVFDPRLVSQVEAGVALLAILLAIHWRRRISRRNPSDNFEWSRSS